MPENQWKKVTRNDPNVIVTLLPRSFRAYNTWADPHNEPFYIPPKSPGHDEGSREVVGSSASDARQPTPEADDPGMTEPYEPALQITFSRGPKNPALGYLIGSDRSICDIYFGSTHDWISQKMFTITVNQYNQVIMTSLNNAKILVSYDKQQEERRKFTWIFPAEQETIFVQATKAIMFTVEVPTHGTDKVTYERNCQNFLALASSASRTLNLLKPSSQPSTGLQSGATSSRVSTKRPFYLRTVKLGSGGFAKVHKAISMPGGRTVAVKRFKAKSAWALEADVLRKISKTPHYNIVQFIDLGLGKKPYLVLGLAPGGNLAEQNQIAPFTTQEVVLILRQMLDALVFLHGQHITHRDLKPANILCDSREHFRLADFGVAKEGDFLVSKKGTKFWMAPEMFLSKPYTAAVDIYALGLVIAWLLIGSFPREYRVDEGPSWCEALIAHFNEYEERSRLLGNQELEQISLTALVGDHMLRMNPEERESAPGCLERGDFLWWMLKHANNNSNTIPQGHQDESLSSHLPLNNAKERSKDAELTEKHEILKEKELESEGEGELEGEDNECLGDEDSTEDVDTEAVTEVQSLNTDEWLSLEREHAINENERKLVPQHFIDGSFIDDPDNMPGHSATLPDSDGQSGPESSQRKQDASSAAPSRVQTQSQKRK